MKKLIYTLIFLFTLSGVAQDKEWSFGLGAGAHSFVNSLDNTDLFLNVNGNVRYMFNNKFGVGLYAGYDNLVSDNELCPYDSDFYRGSIEGVFNIGRALKFETFTKNFTLLVHGGVGAGYFNGEAVKEWTFNTSGGVTGLYRLSNNFALRADVSSTGIVGQPLTLNAEHPVQTNGIDSYLHTYTVGITFYPGSKKKVHNDWKEDKKPEPVITKVIREIETKTVVHEQVCCDETLVDNIYSEETSDEIQIHALNELQKVADYLVEHPEAKINLVGSACTTHGTDEYNQKLSESRAENVYNKLISMGVAPERLTHWGTGRDVRYVGKANSDLAKRVEIRVVEQ